MSVIDLNRVRQEREQPDPEHVKRDQFGRPMYRFALEYEMGGKTWAVEVWAYDWNDAERRVAAMRDSLTVLGQVFETVAG